MGAVVSAVEGEVAQSGEVTLDPVEEAGIGRHVGQLQVVGLRPLPDPGVFLGRQVRAVVVHDDGDARLGRLQAAQIAAERQELGPVLRRLHVPVETATVHVQRPEQVPDSLDALVGGPLPAPPRVIGRTLLTAPSTCATGPRPRPAKAGITVDPDINSQPTTTSKARDQP